MGGRSHALAGAVALGTALLAALGVPTPASPDPPRPQLTLSADTTVGSTPNAVAAVAPMRRRTATIVMGGDLLWHSTVWASAKADGGGRYDFAPMFAGVAPVFDRADLALCHEEVPFAAKGQAPQNFPVFAAPREAAEWIGDFGFDGCTTASNHSLDQGYDGLVRTADLLGQQGVAHIGTFRTQAERRTPVVLTTEAGVRVGVVAGTFGTNGFPLPEGREWSVSLWDAPNLLAQARAARTAGADLVVVHLHGGDEYSHLPNAAQVELVERLTRSKDVDLVLGEHAHVVQPITKVNGTWVAYGMGNMVAQQDPARHDTYQGILSRFTFTERRSGRWAVTRAGYVPIGWDVYSSSTPIRVHRLRGAAADEVGADVEALGGAPGLRRG